MPTSQDVAVQRNGEDKHHSALSSQKDSGGLVFGFSSHYRGPCPPPALALIPSFHTKFLTKMSIFWVTSQPFFWMTVSDGQPVALAFLATCTEWRESCRAPALHCPASSPKTWLLTPTQPLTCSLTLDKSCYGNLCSVVTCKVMWVIPKALVPPGAKILLIKSLIHILVPILPATVYSLRAMPLRG